MNARRALLLLALALGCPACDEPPPPFEMQPLARQAAPPAAPDQPAPAPAPAPTEAEPADAQPAAPAEPPIPEGAVRLAWKVPADGALGFLAGLSRASGLEQASTIEPLARSGELPAELANRLKGLRPSTPASMVALLSANPGGTFTARFTGQEREGSENRDPNVAKLAEAETVVLWEGSLGERGQAIAYSLSPTQRLTLGLLFELPSRPVKPGDTWELDVELLPREERLVVEDSARWNQVRLVALEPLADGEQVAVLEYRLAQVERGKLMEPDAPAQPITRLASYLGRAEFLVKRGSLRLHAGWLQTSVEGAERVKERRTLALTAMDKVPRELIDLR